jgi:Predicted UDP-glucose 6-dehydrogenase
MRIGVNGMGKLGLPVALAIESKGHEVIGCDIRPEPYEYIENRQIPYQEEGLQPLLDRTQIKNG